jgi:hypothetical protein
MKCRCGLSYVDHEYGIVFKTKHTRFAFEEDVVHSYVCLIDCRVCNGHKFNLYHAILIVHVHQIGEFYTILDARGMQFRMNNVYRKFHLHNRGFHYLGTGGAATSEMTISDNRCTSVVLSGRTLASLKGMSPSSSSLHEIGQSFVRLLFQTRFTSVTDLLHPCRNGRRPFVFGRTGLGAIVLPFDTLSESGL